MKPTHKVLDTIYTPDEGQDCFAGSINQCLEFVSEQNTYGLQIVQMTKEEIDAYPEN